METSTNNRDAIEFMIEEYGRDALKLNVEDIRLDADSVDPQILAVLHQTQSWLRRGDRDLSVLFDVYCNAETKRKGRRARLPKTLLAAEKRLEWKAEEHPAAQPLHYRWSIARGFLRDLFADLGSGDDNGGGDA